MSTAKFTKKNLEFTCDHCGKAVPPSDHTCRDHCPFCLYSKHVDINPGDRANPCKGSLRPVGYHKHKKKGWMIDYECLKCGGKHRNIAILDNEAQPDDYDVMLALTPKADP